jgi:hypothetical protein
LKLRKNHRKTLLITHRKVINRTVHQLPESALKKNITERKRVRGSVWRKKRKTDEERRDRE